MGHIILNWGSYSHLHLQPVLSDQTTYIPFIFLMFLTSICELIPYLWISWPLLGVFGPSIYFISNPSPITLKRRRLSRPNWKWLKKWRRRKLHYFSVYYCRLQPKNHPPCLGGSFLLSHYCDNHWIWRRDRACAKYFFNRRWMDDFFSGRKDGYRTWESEGVSKNARDSFYRYLL